MESQPQNPEFRNNPENFHPCNMYLGSLYCIQIWTQFRLGSSLLRVHSVCFHDEILSEVHLNICSRRKMQTTFSGQKNIGRIRFNETVLLFQRAISK